MAVDTISAVLRGNQHQKDSTDSLRSLNNAMSRVSAEISVILELALYAAEDVDGIMDSYYKQELKKKVRDQRNSLRDQKSLLDIAVDALHADDTVVIDAAIIELEAAGVDYSDRFPAISIDVE